LAANFLGEGHSKIKPRVDDALEAVVEAGHLREGRMVGGEGWQDLLQITNDNSKIVLYLQMTLI
jgi:hypothetical protein